MALICRSKDCLACLPFMPDLVGEDSHTQLQVEVLRNLSSGLQGHPKNLSMLQPMVRLWLKSLASWLRS